MNSQDALIVLFCCWCWCQRAHFEFSTEILLSSCLCVVAFVVRIRSHLLVLFPGSIDKICGLVQQSCLVLFAFDTGVIQLYGLVVDAQGKRRVPCWLV